MKLTKLLLLLFIFIITFSQPILAKKSLLKQAATGTGGNSVVISPKLRSPDRLALIVNFSNLLTAKSVSYSLTYNSQRVSQGVAGSIKPEVNTTSRELLFGTCSSGVCRYHTNITNMRFVVTVKLKSGSQFTKSYRVKP